MSKKNRFKGDPHHVLRERLMYIIEDSSKCKRWIREFFEQCPDVPSFALRFKNKKLDNKLRDGLFDGEDFVKRLRNTIEDGFIPDPGDDLAGFEDFDPLRDDFGEWVQDNVENQEDTWASLDADDPAEDWLRNIMETEHHKNRAKRAKEFRKIKGNTNHPMERLSSGDDDAVGVFPISYVEYLERQNDLLRKNAKEDKDGKK